MERENRLIKRHETISTFDKKDIDTALGLFWITMCLDYFVYFQKNKLTEENKDTLNYRRSQIQNQLMNILDTVDKDNFHRFLTKTQEKELAGLDDLNFPGKKTSYAFFGPEYPRKKIDIMHRLYMKTIMPVSGVYIDDDLCKIVLYNFNKIIEECGFDTKNDNTIENSESVTTYKELMKKFRNKMIYIDTFEFSEQFYEFED